MQPKPHLMIKKETCKKNNCLIQLISLVIICLLLLAVASIGCYCYYTRDCIVKYNTHNHINNLKEISSKNRRCCYFGGITRIEDFNFNSILLVKNQMDIF